MSEFTIASPRWDGTRVSAVCILMRTKHYRDGHKITEPIGVTPDPEAASQWIAKMVRGWSTDPSVVLEECPTYYFVPVPSEMP